MLFDGPCSAKIIRNKYERGEFKAQSPRKHFSNLIMSECGPPSLHWRLGHKAMRSLVQESLGRTSIFQKAFNICQLLPRKKITIYGDSSKFYKAKLTKATVAALCRS